MIRADHCSPISVPRIHSATSGRASANSLNAAQKATSPKTPHRTASTATPCVRGASITPLKTPHTAQSVNAPAMRPVISEPELLIAN